MSVNVNSTMLDCSCPWARASYLHRYVNTQGMSLGKTTTAVYTAIVTQWSLQTLISVQFTSSPRSLVGSYPAPHNISSPLGSATLILKARGRFPRLALQQPRIAAFKLPTDARSHTLTIHISRAHAKLRTPDSDQELLSRCREAACMRRT